MIDVIVYKLSPYELVFIHDKPLGVRPVFIIYHIKHERVYVSYKFVRETERGYRQGTGKLIILIIPRLVPVILFNSP